MYTESIRNLSQNTIRICGSIQKNNDLIPQQNKYKNKKKLGYMGYFVYVTCQR